VSAALPTADVELNPLELQNLNGGDPIAPYTYFDLSFPLTAALDDSAVTLEPGDTLYLEFTRSAGTGAYAGTVGFMRTDLALQI
jgi:hypothetical protein